MQVRRTRVPHRDAVSAGVGEVKVSRGGGGFDKNDLELARKLPELDEPIDHLFKQFFRELARLQHEEDIEWASSMVLAARYLERIADNAVDIGERLKSVKQKLGQDLAFGNGVGCVKAATDKIEVAAVHVHASYLRVYVNATAHASVYLPCPN